ncbi:MAG: hypothetical protein ATN36_05735 [Epulopiscium sp. Nele67-Bin005]|nr:MAG: hypothetical protein ATN36_05735 [Epulopiscium sp. Nele67-Bin005]
MKNKRYKILGGALLAYALFEPYWQQETKYHIAHAQIPQSFDGFKIAFLADIHFGHTLKNKGLSKIVKRVNDWKPDLILLGGDYITFKKHIEPCFDELSYLRAKHGVYAVMGNHDVVEGLEETEIAMQKANIKSINNSSLWIKQNGEKIKLGGVGDLRTQTQDIKKTTFDTKFEDYIILVSHNPRYVYQLKDEDDINLILSGHTHGAQFSFLKYLSKFVPEFINEKTALAYLTGKEKREGRDIIVSNGVGTAKLPFRIMTRPESVFITLHSYK